MPFKHPALPRTSHWTPLALLVLATFALLLGARSAPVLPQYEHYHQFADQRTWLGIPHIADVLSNLPFAIMGVWGLLCLRRVQHHAALARPVVHGCGLFFAGLVATALGSGYYHWMPNDAGLLLDRLGMVLPFAGLLGLWAYEWWPRRSALSAAHAGYGVAVGALLLGAIALWSWYAHGDLLLWVLLQGGGMVALLLACKPTPGHAECAGWRVAWHWVVLAYTLAKLCEWGDHLLWHALDGWVAGHTLKHVCAAAAAWPVVQALQSVMQNARHLKETAQ
ncbi:hypothetical protein KIK84_09040 [Curvibacter sp. CHRR-16]|uniref:hypothetical protein n=1 Tax=Curvibacter sp. CHRR-16 TaxID=2835872 RepID=UPI001BD98ABA|nr:hypothetical protein [Curvibacter sp. CHRR-16]MBT0570473.1 hypothetical protein [Curvibacter sp. CHRR-16]